MGMPAALAAKTTHLRVLYFAAPFTLPNHPISQQIMTINVFIDLGYEFEKMTELCIDHLTQRFGGEV